MNCPRCQRHLLPSRDDEAAGDCLNCGPIYVPTISDPRAELASEVHPFPNRQRNRGASGSVANPLELGGHQDGCDESPSCLDCPLPECKYVSLECPSCGAAYTQADALQRHRVTCQRQLQIKQARAAGVSIDQVAARFGVSRRSVFRLTERTEPMEDQDKLTDAPMRILSTHALGEQCLASLRVLADAYSTATARIDGIRAEATKLVKIADLTEITIPDNLRALSRGKAPQSAPRPHVAASGERFACTCGKDFAKEGWLRSHQNHCPDRNE